MEQRLKVRQTQARSEKDTHFFLKQTIWSAFLFGGYMGYDGLLVGLGNPGSNYAHTRHNAGYDTLDQVISHAEEHGRVREMSGTKFSCLLYSLDTPLLEGLYLGAKPLTFMNLSGLSVRPLLSFHKLTPQNLIVIHDELDIPAGSLRFKFGGGNAGHNGLKSISQELGTNDFYRLRIGIGRPLHKNDVTNWVLGRPEGEEKEKIALAMREALSVLQAFSTKGLEAAVTLARQKSA